jgi:phosphoglycolate/pyridoxal phosphate phosphatase family enzyme
VSISDLYDAFLLDLDGVVYLGREVVPGAAAAIAELRRREKAVIFITNDSRGVPPDYVAKLATMDIPAREDEVMTAASATAEYIKEHFGATGRSVFVIGTREIKAEMARVGLKVVEGDAGRVADYVVVGLHEDFHYQELRTATQAVRAGAVIFAPNRDPVFPMPDGLWPGSGSILAAVETAGASRGIAIGKPELPMFEMALRKVPPGARVAMVGDRLDSDVAGGKRAGVDTVLVLSGSTSAEELEASEIKPDHVLPDLAALLAD